MLDYANDATEGAIGAQLALKACECLKVIIQACWPRIGVYLGAILAAIVKAWSVASKHQTHMDEQGNNIVMDGLVCYDGYSQRALTVNIKVPCGAVTRHTRLCRRR